MSAIKNTPVWPIDSEGVNSKYEKCRNITEEIYKRINITFQIKKLETAVLSNLSDQSDQIDSNELSNETDLFACDKSSISSSTDVEQRALEQDRSIEKYININNNEEQAIKKPIVVHKRPKKRFRKRVKKRQPSAARESDGSSDEALPLSRMVDIDTKADDETGVMGVPNFIIVTKDLKSKIKKDSPKKKETQNLDSEKQPVVLETIDKLPPTIEEPPTIDKQPVIEKQTQKVAKDEQTWEWKNCSLCGTAFRGERGLRRHMAMTHKVY